jgi:hypothetical protein
LNIPENVGLYRNSTKSHLIINKSLACRVLFELNIYQAGKAFSKYKTNY